MSNEILKGLNPPQAEAVKHCSSAASLKLRWRPATWKARNDLSEGILLFVFMGIAIYLLNVYIYASCKLLYM